MRNQVGNIPVRASKARCDHDYKNAIRIGEVDYVCPLCKELLDPLEWFLMNSFAFVDVSPVKGTSRKKRCAKCSSRAPV